MKQEIPARSLYKHLLLFILTVYTTYMLGGLTYSLSLMSILLAHEMGHFAASKLYGLPSTLPFFIPLPLPPFGTLGAVIKMKGRIQSRRALFDIGAAGPLMGLLVACPVIVVGLLQSQIVAGTPAGAQQHVALGDSLLFKFFQRLVLGKVPSGYDVLLSPAAYAGWVGLFVTALNLLPVGQLDGGHVIYALFGQRGRYISYLTLGTLSVICLLYNPGWVLLVALLYAFGLKHPPPADDFTPLDPKRRILGLVLLLIFLFSFTPVPFPEYTP